MIHDSGKSLLELINDILDFSKIESGKIKLHEEWFEIRERIVESLRSLTHKAHEKQVELICNIDHRIPVQLLGDVQRLRQILLNLVGNSIKFTTQGEVGVDIELVRHKDDKVKLKFEVRDTGIGIPEDKLAAIFDEFVQVDTSTTRNFGGTGLGLAITSQLIGLMGGELKVTSNLNEGSKFFFELEFAVGSNPALPSVPDELIQKSIAVIAKGKNTRASFENVLKSWNMVVYSFDSADDAIRLLSGLEFGQQSCAAILAEASLITNDQFQSTVFDSLDFQPPPIIEIAKTISNEEMSDCATVVSRRIFHPVKHSELKQNLLNCLLPADEIETEVAVSQQVGTGNFRILLAEDDPVNQKLALGILSKYKHDVMVVNNGLEAVETIQHKDFDVILMDVQMPVMDGLEATDMIRKNPHPQKSEIPILALTAHAMVSDRQRCLESGMDDYLSKPYTPADLMAKIEQLVGNRTAERTTAKSGPSNKPTSRLVDWPQAFETVGGDRKLLCELIEVFLKEKANMVADLEKSIAASDPKAIRRCSHTIKGTLNHLGAHHCAEIAWSIEESCDAPTDENWEKCNKLKETLEELTLELKRFSRVPSE